MDFRKAWPFVIVTHPRHRGIANRYHLDLAWTFDEIGRDGTNGWVPGAGRRSGFSRAASPVPRPARNPPDIRGLKTQPSWTIARPPEPVNRE